MNTTTINQNNPSSTRRRWRRAAAAIGGLGLAVALFVAPTPAEAGTTGFVSGTFTVQGLTADTDIDNVTVRLYMGGSPANVNCSVETPTVYEPTFAMVDWSCSNVALNIEYTVAVDGIDDYELRDGYFAGCNPVEVTPDEQILSPDLVFTLDAAQAPSMDCVATFGKAGVLIDKIVDGGDATAGDFTIEVYPSGGGDPATATDPNDALCTPMDLANCALVDVDSGTYQLGEAPAPGYLPTNAACVPYYGAPTEVFPSGVGEFTVSTDEAGPLFMYCQITNEPFGASLYVNKVVINDDGDGQAAAEAFTAEAFTEPGGSLVASTQCAADGTCIATTIPIGEYRIGETGPAGYDASVVCETTVEPDPPLPGTTPPSSIPLNRDFEAIAGDGATVLLEAFGVYTCTITNDDIATTTTTSTTTTTTIAATTTTTIAATTTTLTTPATTTSIPAILPPTGPNDSTAPIALVALINITTGPRGRATLQAKARPSVASSLRSLRNRCGTRRSHRSSTTTRPPDEHPHPRHLNEALRRAPHRHDGDRSPTLGPALLIQTETSHARTHRLPNHTR